MISVVSVSFNEAEKLDKCLSSAYKFADEIIIIELGAIDSTDAIAKKYHARLYKQKFVPYVELIRNFAISKTKGNWILILDPDEMITLQLADELKKISQDGGFDAVNIPRKNIFFGRWIKHTNWWPDRHIRFFKKGKVEWSNKIHSYPKVEGKTLDLEAKGELAILHYGYKSISEFLDRQNRYSSIEARNLYMEGVKFSWGAFFWKPMREFFVRFIKHSGFLDGFYGFALTFFMMVYQLEVMIKLWEKNKRII